MSLQTFFKLDNIDLWFLGWIIFSIFWTFYKAIEHDYEKHEERIKELEKRLEELKENSGVKECQN